MSNNYYLALLIGSRLSIFIYVLGAHTLAMFKLNLLKEKSKKIIFECLQLIFLEKTDSHLIEFDFDLSICI